MHKDLIDEDECYVVAGLQARSLKSQSSCYDTIHHTTQRTPFDPKVLTFEAPEKPLCPDLPTAAPTSSGTVDATSASSTDAKTAAVKAAEAMEGMPIPAGVVDQARISYK